MRTTGQSWIYNIYWQRVMAYAENRSINYHKVLVCIDKFKDTLSATDAAHTIQVVLQSKFND